jgi:hypothetical protein
LDLIGNQEQKICVKTRANKNQEIYQMNDLNQNGLKNILIYIENRNNFIQNTEIDI